MMLFGQVWCGGGIIPNNTTEQFSHLIQVLARNERYRNQNYYICEVFVMLKYTLVGFPITFCVIWYLSKFNRYDSKFQNSS